MLFQTNTYETIKSSFYTKLNYILSIYVQEKKETMYRLYSSNEIARNFRI